LNKEWNALKKDAQQGETKQELTRSRIVEIKRDLAKDEYKSVNAFFSASGSCVVVI